MSEGALRNTCQRTVGRVLEIRHDAGYHAPSEVDAMIARVRTVAAHNPTGAHLLIVADWRRCTRFVLGTETAERVLTMLDSVNTSTMRSALLVSPSSPTAVMQLMRLVSESKLKDRRTFTSSVPLCDWLGELATPEERARVKAFLEEI